MVPRPGGCRRIHESPHPPRRPRQIGTSRRRGRLESRWLAAVFNRESPPRRRWRWGWRHGLPPSSFTADGDS